MALSEASMNWFSIFLKGVAMGAANVVPGVSGGTVAFITGIYERLINAVKSLGGPAMKPLFAGRFRAFAEECDLGFLVALGSGAAISILSLARALEFLFAHHETQVWAFFFGLILASVFFVGAKVGRWGAGTVFALLVGTGIAVSVTLLSPASENGHWLYLVLCGVAAMASMIIPGLSGSFVLLLMGNYHLVMIATVSRLAGGDWGAFRVLLPVGTGAVIGLVALSHLLAWIFRRFHDVAVALLTGFVAGSLVLIWPWKRALTESFGSGERIREKVVGYEWFFPGPEAATWGAVALMAAGFAAVWWMESSGRNGEDGDS